MELVPLPVELPKADAAQNAAALRAAENERDVREAAQQFEAMFMSEMLNHMHQGIDADGVFGGGRGEEVFRSLLVQEYGQMIARSGQVKISDGIAREMLRMQEEQRNPRGEF